MRLLRLLTLCSLLTATPVWAQTWTNEPAGSQVVLDCGFAHPTCNGALQDIYNTSGTLPAPPSAGTLSVVTDGTAPVSPAAVLRSTIFAGNNFGGTQLNYVTPQVYNEMYMGLMWRTNPGFFGRPANNKTFFIRGPGNNGVWYMVGPPGGPFRMVFSHNSGALDNSHTCGAQLGLGCEPNVGSGAVPVGIWHKLEAYVKKSTTATSRDGIVRWWVDGVPAGNYTNMNYAQNGLNEWVWSETWDGTVNPVPATDWSHFLDHLHISIPNCPPGGCVFTGGGGGGSTPPPPPSPVPPLGVGNLRFGS